MSQNEKIKSAIDRVTSALIQRPSFGLGTGISKTTIVNGLTCEIREGDWKLVADMPEQVGGNGAGPVPGVYGRAALGSCLAIGYMMRAAQMGITINALEVEVQADYDDGALFATTDKFPGYSEVRYSVTVDSEAPEKDIQQLIEEADKHSPYLDVFSRGQKCVRKVYFVSQKSH